MGKISVLALGLFICLAGTAVASGGGGVHWGYSGTTGPTHWAALAPEFNMCGEGQKQSPINIVGAIDGNLPELAFNYAATALELVNNGHTIKVEHAAGSSIRVGGDEYRLLQFHFHSTSENAIEGKLFPLEAHLVHANAAGKLAVVGVMFDQGAANPLLEKLWRYTPSKANSTMSVASSVSVTDLLPSNTDYYTFTGSLTTPPCTEGVRWMVLKQPVTLSKQQLEKFSGFFGGHDTNRPVQPLYGRTISK